MNVHFNVGTLQCSVLGDGLSHFRATSFFANAPEAELQAALDRHHIRQPQIPTAFNCLLVRAGGHTVLVDTGLGQGTGTGHLLDALQAEGIARESVDMVILSHSHFDHTNGVLNEASDLAFPKARYLLTEAEWDFWRSQDISVTARAAIQSQVTPIALASAPDAELLPGLSIIAAPGHTPGHIAVLLSSAGKRLLYPGDAVAHPIHLEHPDWNIALDADREQTIQTRRKLLRYVTAEQIPLLVYHFPPPGLCRVEAHGSAWSAVAISAVD